MPTASRRRVGYLRRASKREARRSAAQPPQKISIEGSNGRLESSADGITIHGSSVRGIGVVPLKATMIIPGTMEEISLVLEDIARRRE